MDAVNGPTIGPVAERATATDIPDLIDVWWDSFSSDFIQRIYPQTPDGRVWLERGFQKNFEPTAAPGEPRTECLFVRDLKSGKPAAMAVYRIIPAGCDPERHSWRVRWPPFDDLPDIREDVLAGFFDPMEKTQAYLLGDRGHIHLEALGTMKAHQKKGYATALIKWGSDLADELGIECYLDASAAGKPLYAANGYIEQDVSAVVEKPAGAVMVRPKNHYRGLVFKSS